MSSCARRAACTLAAALLAAGCGGGDSRREAVEDYIRDVNRIQRRYQDSLAAANAAYRRFSTRRPTKQQVRRLRDAQGSILAMRSELARVRPPAEARKLHADLLLLLRLDLGVALEVTELAEYVPLSRRVLARLGPVNARFRNGFATARTAAAQEEALGRYATALRTIASDLDRLGPPPALAPWQATEVGRLRATASAAAALRDALARRDVAAVAAQAGALVRAAAVRRAQAEAQRQAVKAYNARLARIDRVTARIDRERERLADAFS